MNIIYLSDIINGYTFLEMYMFISSSTIITVYQSIIYYFLYSADDTRWGMRTYSRKLTCFTAKTFVWKQTKPIRNSTISGGEVTSIQITNPTIDITCSAISPTQRIKRENNFPRSSYVSKTSALLFPSMDGKLVPDSLLSHTIDFTKWYPG